MSKMGQELEKRLDENKYELYEVCKESLESDKADPNKPVATVEGHPVSAAGLARYHMRQVLAKIEG